VLEDATEAHSLKTRLTSDAMMEQQSSNWYVIVHKNG